MGFPDLKRAANGDIIRRKDGCDVDLTGIDEWKSQEGWPDPNPNSVTRNINEAAEATGMTADEVLEKLQNGETVSY
jgi:hypothetical protein